MPLSDLYRVNKGKVDSNQDFETGNDLFELVWEKGQVMMQSQSDSFPPYSHRIQDKDVGNHSNGKTGKFGTLDSVFNEISTSSMPSGEIGLNQDEDVMTWLNDRIDESLRQEYCPDFMPELSSVTVHELSTCNSFLSLDKTSFNPIYRNSSINSSNDVSKVTSVGDAEVSLPRSGSSQLYPSSSSSSSSSQQCQSSFPFFRSGISDIIDGNITSVADHAISYDSGCVLSSSGSFPSSKMQNLDPIPPRSSSSIMNFSHFSSSVTLLKDNLQKVGSTTCSNLSSMERITNTGKDTPAASNNPLESAAINSICGSRQKTNSQCQVVASGVDLTPVEARLEEPCAEMHPAMVFLGNASKNDARTNQVPSESAIRGTQDADNTVELVVASSVCSVSSVGITSDDPTHGLKRKGRDADELECHSENAEEESVGVKKTGPTPATSSKRGRAAEVHNLSERRRRDRINEKMRALQELIPNCNKVDKSSMLEDAIEYLKSLQLQVQIMSMGTGMYMQPMMLPTGMQQMQSPHMAHFSHMGVGMGTGMYMQPMMLPTGMQQMQSPHMAHFSHMGVGMGYGMAMPDMNNGPSHYPMMRLPPPMQGAPFPGPPMSGYTVLPGMAGSNHQVLGVRGQGLPMQMQCAPFPPVPGGHFMKSSMDPNACAAGGSTENVESVLHSTSKVPMQNINLQVMQSTGINGSLDPIASQIQATNEGLRKSTTGRNNVQVSVLNGGRVSDTVNENYVWPS